MSPNGSKTVVLKPCCTHSILHMFEISVLSALGLHPCTGLCCEIPACGNALSCRPVGLILAV